MSSAAEPFLKEHHAKLAVQIILIDRLVTAASVLEEQGVQLPDETLAARLHRMAAAAATMREAILGRRWPKFQEPIDVPPQVAGVPPMLLELERVMHLLSKAEERI